MTTPIHAPGSATTRGESPRPAPGQNGLVMLGLSAGVLMMAVQLWLLTLAFNLFLSGERTGTLLAAVVSGAIFLGGLAMMWVLRRSRHERRSQ